MIYGYARVTTDGQSVAAQVAALATAAAERVFGETASGAQTSRAQLCRAVAALEEGDVLIVTRLDRLARSTRARLNTLAAVAGRKAGFRSLGDAWADTTTAHGRLKLTVPGGLAEFERELIRAHAGKARAPRHAARGTRHAASGWGASRSLPCTSSAKLPSGAMPASRCGKSHAATTLATARSQG